MSFPTGRLLVVLLSPVIFALTSPAQSGVLIVSNTQDSGAGSLRDTIAAAASGDTIEFNLPTSDPGYEPLSGVFTIRLTSGEIVIQSDLTIANVSGAKIAVSGNYASRIFTITSGTVAISDLSLINGNALGASGFLLTLTGMPGIGGAVLNQGTLTITRCTFFSNTARGGMGGSILGGAGPGGDGLGGAVANQNSLSLVACTLASNSALGGVGGANEVYPCYCWYFSMGGMGSGGAIYNASNSTLSLSNCTITANGANGCNARAFTGTDYHHAGLGATGQGGGIANFGYLTIVHCTVANNVARGGASSAGNIGPGPLDGGTSFGGGLYCGPDSASGVRDVIFARNRTVGGAPGEPPAVAGAAVGPDVNAAITSEGHNLLGRSDGSAGFRADDQLGGATDETGLDPMLGDLANNGGPTQTLALLPGSPAINQGELPGENRDQRYFLRSGPPDIGAFEYEGTQPTLLANISTRVRVQTGDGAMVGGFIITGTEPKTVIVRGIGPSLSLPGALADPLLEIHDSSGELLAFNDNWRDAGNRQDVIGSGLPPANDLESAFLGSLSPGAYTVVLRGMNDTTGIGLFEVYDLNQTVESKLANVSTRGFVDTDDNAMIGGTIIVGSAPRVLVRAIGPSLTNLGVPDSLGDPVLELYGSNGELIATNNNWRDDQEAEIIATGIPPSNNLESAIVRDLSAGSYTAIVRGQSNTTGVALIEVYDLN